MMEKQLMLMEYLLHLEKLEERILQEKWESLQIEIIL